MATFVLVHAPLVGPTTWRPVARELRRRGHDVAVPHLERPPAQKSQAQSAKFEVRSRIDDDRQSPARRTRNRRPYWARHAAAVAESVRRWGPDRPLVYAGHSGAGQILPAVRAVAPNPAAGYIFVDAGLPEDGKSRLDQFPSFEAAEAFRQRAVDGLLPTWTESDLVEAIPDATVRREFVAELRPLPLAVYEEALPVFAGWPDAPCAYLRFGDNPAYAAPVAEAQRRGWPSRFLEGDHFHMLVDPPAVADALLTLAGEIGVMG